MSDAVASSPAAATPTPALPLPTVRSLLGLAFPIVISRSTQVVVGLTDALMVAGLGESALAATTTGAMNTYTLVILPMGICFIIASFSAQLTGRGDALGARRFGFYGLLLAALFQVLAFSATSVVPYVLGHLSYDPSVRGLMTTYLVVRLGSVGAMVGLEALGSYYGGIGNTKLPMAANILAMVANVGLNWVLIFGHLGAPAMGVRGAALASAVSSWLGFAFLLGVFLWHGRALGAVVPRLRLAELGRMLRFGLPSGFNWFLEFMAFMFFVNVVVAGLGTTTLAALMSVIQINSMSFMPAFGLASAGAILVGQYIGAEQKDVVPKLVRITFTAAAVWQGAVGLAYFLFPETIFSPFVQGSASRDLLMIGARMLMLSAAWQLFDAAANTIAECLRAAGDTAFPMWMRIALGWLVFAPGSYLSVRWAGGNELVAVGWLVGYIAVLALVLYLRFRSGAWRKIQLVEPTV